MNKKFKIVSSIALAGMLLTGGLGMNKVNAAESEKPPIIDTTKVLGMYKKLVEGKTVVPVVLANKNDRATVKELVDSDIFTGEVSRINGNAVTSLDTVLATGDRVTTTDGTEFTVVVYGDVNKDGSVSIVDALDVQKYSVGNYEGGFDDVQQEAADVKNNGSIDIVDALYIAEFVVGNQGLVAPEPAPEEEVVEESNYSITLNKGGYVNNVNDDGSTLEVSLKETLDESKTIADNTALKLVVSDSDEATLDVEKQVEIPAHMDYVTVSGIDLSGLKDGTLTAILYDGNEVVAKYEIVKNANVKVDTAKVSTDRVSTRSATLSLESMGESNVTKVRYVVLDKEASQPNIEALTKTLDVQNNKLTDATIADNLVNKQQYRVWFVAENEYGSISAMKSALITTDEALTTEPKLAEVKAPDLTKAATASFELVKDEKDTDSHTYVVTLYKDGVAIAEKDDVAVTSVSFTDEIAKAGVGTYKVSVVTKGNEAGTSESSEAVDSAEVTVTQLKAVENLKIENLENDSEGNAIVSWTNPNGKDDFEKYEINLYTVDGEGKEELAQGNVACDNDKNEVKVTLTANKIYIAKVKLKAKEKQMAVVASEEVVSDQFYIVAAPLTTSSTVGSTSIKIPVTPIEIPNKEVSYKMEVYHVNTPFDPTKPTYVDKTVRDVTIEKVANTNPVEYQITIDGLNPTTDYAFRLVAVVDGNEVESNYSAPVTTLPVFENVTVTENKDEATEGSNKVAIADNYIYMDGAKYDTTYITELEDAYTVIDALEAGDVVTMNDDATEVSIVLDGRAGDRTFNSEDTFKDSTVEITSNAFTKKLIGDFKALKLSGTNSIFDVSSVKITDKDNEDIVLTGNIEVTVGEEDVSREYKVEAGSENVIINDVKVTTAEEITLTANKGKNLVVDANTTENDIVFENTTVGDANIEFFGAEDNTSEQRGTITIKTANGKVIVTAPQVNVSADMVVEVNNGEVDITSPSLTGDKTVTVSATEGKSSKVFANTATEAPEELLGKTVELATYEDTDDFIRKTYGEDLSQDKVIAIREYINSFGLRGTEAEIKVEDADTVTITLPSEAQDMEIGNIK